MGAEARSAKVAERAITADTAPVMDGRDGRPYLAHEDDQRGAENSYVPDASV